MILITKRFILSLLVLFCVQAAYSQDISGVVKKVEALVNDASSWKIQRRQERNRDDSKVMETDWVNGREIVGVYLYQEPSVEAAANLLEEMRTAPVESIATTGPVGRYDFGDESYIRSNGVYSTSSYILFRKGNVVVRIDSTSSGKITSACTLKNAVRFARLFEEQL